MTTLLGGEERRLDPTAGAMPPGLERLLLSGPEPGGLKLQEHGQDVRFRNVWVIEKK